MKFAHIKQTLHLFLVAGLVFFIAGCDKDDEELGAKPTASFTISPVAGRVNTFALQSTSENAFGYQWDKGNGTFAKGQANDTAYFPVKGSYIVKLRAFGRGGYDSTAQTVSVIVDDILNNPIFKLLTAKSWKLNPEPGVNPIIVGTESNPSQYFGGGALADCQMDDVYTFSTGLKLTYNANGSTFNGGNVAPNFNCGSDRSYNNISYTFDPSVPAGAAGIASITISGTPPTNFIGVTDVSSNNYRIISISEDEMVLRSGTPAETVHQFKFVAQ
jgi:PKD repeat protein